MNKLLRYFVVLGVLANMGHAMASDDLYAIKSIKINASAELVWSKVKNFSDLGAWHPAVAKTEIVAGKDGKKGAKRILTLQDGGQIKETLKAYDSKEKSMQYIITEGVLPVQDYVSTIRVKPNGSDSSVVIWESSFKPKAQGDEKVASDTIDAVYDAGLSNLKKISE